MSSASGSGAGRVLVVGGGLAGITAALDCAAAGASVTLVEVRRRLGGAAYSFERDGLQLDNGQHVFLRCCSAYRGLLARLGSEHLTSIQPRLEIPVLKPGQEPVLLRRGALPAPAHLAGALARYPYLTPAERLGAALAALGLMRLDPDDPSLDAQTFGAWLARRGQGPRALAALWDLIALPTLNLPAAQASLALAAFVFRTGLLSGADAGDIGFHDATLAQILGEPAERALREAGVEVRLGWRAERLEQRAGGVEVHGSETLAAEATVLAVPHARAATLLEPLLGEPARAFGRLGSSPIVNLHVVYDRQVCEQRFAAGVGTPVQYVFDRTGAGIPARSSAGAPGGSSAGAPARASVDGPAGSPIGLASRLPAGCQYLAVSLSGAEREMSIGADGLRQRYLPALCELFPRARGAKVEFFLATREHAATFRCTPGTGALRPGPVTAVPGLLLAGAWTATGWPATLEGAVRSGHAAAAAALRTLGAGAPAQAATIAGRSEAVAG